MPRFINEELLVMIWKWIFKLAGWKVDDKLPPQAGRSVMIAVPHTSNWDFFYARIAFAILKLPVRFTIKKEWLRFPFKRIMLALGAIGIDRSPKKEGEKRLSMTEAMTNIFKENEKIVVLVTPEGTRSLRTEWKTGFYYVALQADVPIMFGYLDYDNKIAGVGGYIHPTGDIEADMQVIMDFYRNKNPKYPEKFSTDLRYDKHQN